MPLTTTRYSKSALRDLPIGSDPKLAADEKETTLTFPNDLDDGRIHTEIPPHIKWVLSVDESEIISSRIVDDQLVAVKARIPKGIFRFQKDARKSDQNSSMVSYGGGLPGDG